MAKAKTKKAMSKKKAQPKPAKKSVKSVKPKSKPVGKLAQSSKPAKHAQSSPAKNSSMKWEEFVTPLDDRMIVQVNSAEKMTAGGLFIPETTKIKGHSQGVVLSVGRGHRDTKGRLRPMDVKKGDRVMFEEFAGAKENLQGIDVRIIRESEILGILEK